MSLRSSEHRDGRESRLEGRGRTGKRRRVVVTTTTVVTENVEIDATRGGERDVWGLKRGQ